MSINENNSLPEGISQDRAVAVHRTPLAESQELGWPAAAAWGESTPPASLNLSMYLHGLRRHWVLATAVGLLCGVAAAAAVYFGYGLEYRYSALVRVAADPDIMVFRTMAGRTSSQRSYDLLKSTQMQVIKGDDVLVVALARKVKPPDELEKPVAQLGILKEERDQVGWLKDEIQVTTDDSEFIMVSLTGSNAWEVTEVVKTVVDVYKEKHVDKVAQDKRERLEKLKDTYREESEERRKLRNQLKNFAVQMDTSESEVLSVKQKHQLMRYAEYQRERTKLQFAWRTATGELQAQRAVLAGLENEVISDVEVDAIARKDRICLDLQSRMSLQLMDAGYQKDVATNGKSAYAKRFQEDYDRTLMQLNEQREFLREQIRGLRYVEIERDIREKDVNAKILAEHVASISKELDAEKEEVEHIGRTSIDIETYQIEVKELDAVLSSIAAERDALNVELEADPRIRIMPFAGKPQTPENAPVRATLIVLAGLAGLCIPAIGIALWDARAKRINSSLDVSKKLGLTVLGSVPMIPASVIRRLGSPSRRNQTWQMRLTESIDGIAARLLRKAALEQTRVVLVSSAVGNEGKTTLATQLAMSLARSGRNTLLVDFDLRRPAFDEVFGLPLEPGVSEVLRREADLDGLAHVTGTDNLSVLTAGRWDRHALAALANGAAGSMFERLRAEYEFIVVDASPVLPVADTRFISQHVDTVVLSVFRDVSQLPKVEAACEILEAFGVDSLEAVVTGSTEGPRDKDMRYEPRLTA